MDIRQATLTEPDIKQLELLAEIQPNLVLVFGSPWLLTHPALLDSLTAVFPQARRIGASTAGEISNQGVGENSLVITAIRFDRITTRIAETVLTDMEDSRAAGQRLAGQLAHSGLRAVILLSQGVGANGSELIAGAVSVLGPHIPLTGGLAGDYGAFRQTWTLLDNHVSDRMMLAVGLYGDRVGFAHDSFGGWHNFGPARRATRAQGNVLLELDGEPALDIYKRYLGEYARGLPASGLLFPFALLSDDRQESALIRTLLGVNEADGSLVLAGDIPQDGYLRLMHASTEALVDGNVLQELLEEGA